MRITSLAENTSVGKGISAEHGLSLFIETEGRRILFDAGQTDLFARNAELLGIDLSLVDIAVLSHGHYDHGGGLRRFLEINDHAPVYVNPYVFEPRYDSVGKYIGLDFVLAENERIIFTDLRFEPDCGITLHSPVGREKRFELGSFGLTTVRDGREIPDDFRHEQYLLIEEKGRRVLFSGCSHNGILNIAEWFSPDVLVGGFHFSGLPLDGTLERYARYLDSFDTDFYTCHCTGVEQFEFMKEHMGRLNYLSAGESIEL